MVGTADADLIVMAVGIKPNVELAKKSGVQINRGIIVNDYMETNIPGIFALGNVPSTEESLMVW